MSDTKEMKPALTAEEWADIDYHQATHIAMMHLNCTPFEAVAVFNASLPDDDPRKLGWADVGRCQRAADDAEARHDNSLELTDYEEQKEWAALAAKLAALMPPK